MTSVHTRRGVNGGSSALEIQYTHQNLKHVNYSLPSLSLSLHPSLSHAPPHHRPVAFLSHRHRHHHRRRRLLSVATAAWTPVHVTGVSYAGVDLCHVTVDHSSSPGLHEFVRAGQYLDIRIPYAVDDPALFYIASPPAQEGEFEFLVRSVHGKTAGRLCTLKKGNVVELSGIKGSGFDMEQLSPPEDYPTVLIFATGYGISSIRSLIETGFSAHKRSNVRLYYGAENLQRMAYQERFKNWDSTGVKVIPVLSRPPANWTGGSGYVQDVYARDKPIADPLAAGAVLCGNPNMIKETRAILVAQGVSPEKILVAE